MSVSIYIERKGQMADILPLSNQPFIESIYIPTAEKMGFELLPLIIRAAGLVVDTANKDTVLAELSAMDERVDRYLRTSNARYVLNVNGKIRKAIVEYMIDSEISLDIG